MQPLGDESICRLGENESETVIITHLLFVTSKDGSSHVMICIFSLSCVAVNGTNQVDYNELNEYVTLCCGKLG